MDTLPKESPPNGNPLAMFEIMALNQSALINFYQAVFDWQVEISSGFGYIKFPLASRALLGGIGQAQPGVIGWEKGLTFYLEVPSIDQSLTDRIQANGGQVVVKRTSVDGYAFAMFEDPEENLVGLVEPF